jgi:GTP-binding protein
MGPPEFTPDELAAGEMLFARAWQFVRSVPDLRHLPPPERREIALAGRSNVGKSSLINALVGQRGLARTSNTPGRTQELNFFETPAVELFLVDMPGYGFAQAPKALVAAWTRLVKDYLRGRPNLLRVLLLIDARHGVKPPDRELMALLDEAAVAYQAVLTKADKIKPTALAEVLEATRTELEGHAAAVPMLIATSAQSGAGIADVRAQIAALAAQHGVTIG